MKDAAADAAVKIAGKLVGDEPKAVAEAMQKVVDAGVGGQTADRAKQLSTRPRPPSRRGILPRHVGGTDVGWDQRSGPTICSAVSWWRLRFAGPTLRFLAA